MQNIESYSGLRLNHGMMFVHQISCETKIQPFKTKFPSVSKSGGGLNPSSLFFLEGKIKQHLASIEHDCSVG